MSVFVDCFNVIFNLNCKRRVLERCRKSTYFVVRTSTRLSGYSYRVRGFGFNVTAIVRTNSRCRYLGIVSPSISCFTVTVSVGSFCRYVFFSLSCKRRVLESCGISRKFVFSTTLGLRNFACGIYRFGFNVIAIVSTNPFCRYGFIIRRPNVSRFTVIVSVFVVRFDVFLALRIKTTIVKIYVNR